MRILLAIKKGFEIFSKYIKEKVETVQLICTFTQKTHRQRLIDKHKQVCVYCYLEMQYILFNNHDYQKKYLESY